MQAGGYANSAAPAVRPKLSAFHAKSPPVDRKAFHERVLEEILQERAASSRRRRNPRGVKRKMSSFPRRARCAAPLPPVDIKKTIRIIIDLSKLRDTVRQTIVRAQRGICCFHLQKQIPRALPSE